MDGSGFETSNAPVNDTGALSFDLNVAIATFRRRFRLFAAVAVVVFAAVVLFTLQQTPLYTATAQVMLDVRKEQVTDMSAVLSGLPADSSVVDTEVEVLKSRSLAGRVVKELKLDQDPYFNPSSSAPVTAPATLAFPDVTLPHPGLRFSLDRMLLCLN